MSKRRHRPDLKKVKVKEDINGNSRKPFLLLVGLFYLESLFLIKGHQMTTEQNKKVHESDTSSKQQKSKLLKINNDI